MAATDVIADLYQKLHDLYDAATYMNDVDAAFKAAMMLVAMERSGLVTPEMQGETIH